MSTAIENNGDDTVIEDNTIEGFDTGIKNTGKRTKIRRNKVDNTVLIAAGIIVSVLIFALENL